MGNKNLVSAILFFSIALIILPLVLGANGNDMAFQAPSSGGIVSGTSVVYNCTFNATTGAENYTRARIYVISAGLTANTTDSLVSNWQINTSGAISVNGTFTTTIVEDSNDYTIKCQIWNGTNYQNKTQSITIDNTIPTTPSELTPSTSTLITTSTTQTFSATVTNRETTSCTYTIARGDTNAGNDYITGTGTYSGNTCSFTKSFSSTTDNGNWYWKITASDETNTTSSTKNIFQVGLPATGSNLPVALQNQQQESSSTTEQSQKIMYWIIGIIFVVIIVFVVRKFK